MTLKEYLLKHTKVGDLCVIRIGGWIEGATYIDGEDLFISSLSSNLLEMDFKSSEWGTLETNAPHQRVQLNHVKYIDL